MRLLACSLLQLPDRCISAAADCIRQVKHSDGSTEDINMELSKEELKSVIADMEKANSVVRDLSA